MHNYQLPTDGVLCATHIAPSPSDGLVDCRDGSRPGMRRNHRSGTWPSRHELPCGGAVAMATEGD